MIFRAFSISWLIDPSRRVPLVSVEIRNNGAKLATDLAIILGFSNKSETDFFGVSAKNQWHEQIAIKKRTHQLPGIRRASGGDRPVFSPPLASSAFHDFVNKGQIVPLKGIRRLYKLNDSLRRLGLREVPKLPEETPNRTGMSASPEVRR